MTPIAGYGAAMPKKPTVPAELAGQMAVAYEIMRQDGDVLRALAAIDSGAEAQMKVVREVMVRRRRALGDLADS
jgi:hypothetical protein